MAGKATLLHTQGVRFCHPAWPGERATVASEIEPVRTLQFSGQKFWLVYEIVILVLLATSIVLRATAMVFDENLTLYKIAKVFFVINMLASFVRVLKICIRFREFSVFLKVSGHAIYSLMQIGFLYLQLYIPFISVFWLMFGGTEGVDLIKSANVSILHHPPHGGSNITTLESFTSLDTIFYTLYESSFGQWETISAFTRIDRTLAQPLISLYHIFATFIILSIFVAFITSKFTTHFHRCVAEASIMQAEIVLAAEKCLGKVDKSEIAKYYAKYCSTLVSAHEPESDYILERSTMSKLEYTERSIANIENNLREVEGREERCGSRSESAIYNSIDQCNESLREKQKHFHITFKKDMKNVEEKQNWMNKKLKTKLN